MSFGSISCPIICSGTAHPSPSTVSDKAEPGFINCLGTMLGGVCRWYRTQLVFISILADTVGDVLHSKSPRAAETPLRSFSKPCSAEPQVPLCGLQDGQMGKLSSFPHLC